MSAFVPAFIAQMCRSCTILTPSTPFITPKISSVSSLSGTASIRILKLSFSKLAPLFMMSSETKILAMLSACVKLNFITRSAATIAPTEPSVSPSTCK